MCEIFKPEYECVFDVQFYASPGRQGFRVGIVCRALTNREQFRRNYVSGEMGIRIPNFEGSGELKLTNHFIHG